MHEHQAHDGQVAGGAEASPEASHFLDGQGNDVEPGLSDAQPAHRHPGTAQTHGLALQISLMITVRDLAGSIGELIADGAVGIRNPVIDRGSGGPRVEAGLEAKVFEQGRFGEILQRKFAGVMLMMPPANEVQQVVSVGAQAGVGYVADVLAVEIPIDPANFPSSGLFDHTERTVRSGGAALMDDLKLHDCAASRRDWNRRASPPSTKKELGSCPSGRSTRRPQSPCSLRRWASCAAACWPLRLASTSKVR